MIGVVAGILVASSDKGVGKGGKQEKKRKNKICVPPADKKSSVLKSGDLGGQVVRSPLPVSVGSFYPRILQCEIMEVLRLPGVAHDENMSFKIVMRISSNTSAYTTPITVLSEKKYRPYHFLFSYTTRGIVLVNLSLNFIQCSLWLLSKVLTLGLCRLVGPGSQRVTSSVNKILAGNKKSRLLRA